MNRNLLAGGVALLVLAVAPLTTGYHIDGSTTAVVDPSGGPALTTADWFVQNTGNLIVCESEGPADDVNDNPGGNIPGSGGLCYTGRNDATGTYAPGSSVFPPLAAGGEADVVARTAVPAAPPAPPTATDWTEIDTCSDTTPTRRTVTGLANPPCTGSTDDHFWFGRVGGIGCDVAPGQSLHYSELWAWWTYELADPAIMPPYSSGDAAGTAHDGIAANNPALNPTGDPGRRDAYHGHVDMFIDGIFLAVSGASASGSAVTTAETSPFLPGAYLDCGASQAPDPILGGTGSGPLFREGPALNPLALPLCADMDSPIAGRLTFACLPLVCNLLPVAVMEIGHLLAPAAGQSVVGDLRCNGVDVFTNTCTDDVAPDLLNPLPTHAVCSFGPTPILPSLPLASCVRDFANPADTYTGDLWYVLCV